MIGMIPQPTRLWHRSQTHAGSGWPEALVPQALSLHLNFVGEARLHWKNRRPTVVRPMTLVWARGATRAARLSGREGHECLTLIYPDAWLRHTLQETHSQMHSIRAWFVSPALHSGSLNGRAVTQEDRTWAQARMAPHLCEQARLLLDGARLTDFLVRELFESPDELGGAPVSRTERVARERVERAKAELLRQIDEAPSLEALALVAGCSPHYLSRTFTQIEGVTLSLWLRRVRMDRAAELLSSGRCNVSEAALEVGYRSLSHFSRAFAEEKGVVPSKWVEHLDTFQSSTLSVS